VLKEKERALTVTQAKPTDVELARPTAALQAATTVAFAPEMQTVATFVEMSADSNRRLANADERSVPMNSVKPMSTAVSESVSSLQCQYRSLNG